MLDAYKDAYDTSVINAEGSIRKTIRNMEMIWAPWLYPDGDWCCWMNWNTPSLFREVTPWIARSRIHIRQDHQTQKSPRESFVAENISGEMRREDTPWIARCRIHIWLNHHNHSIRIHGVTCHIARSRIHIRQDHQTQKSPRESFVAINISGLITTLPA